MSNDISFHTIANAVKSCNDDQKIVYGGFSCKFHVIDSNDRDYNTTYALTKEEVYFLGSRSASLLLRTHNLLVS